MPTRIMNPLQALAMNEGQRRKKKLWSAQGGPSWKGFRELAGLPGAARICSSCWIA
jgi:hypothetical protein